MAFAPVAVAALGCGRTATVLPGSVDARVREAGVSDAGEVDFCGSGDAWRRPAVTGAR